MPSSSSWQQFFDAHAEVYDENVFTQNTAAEIEFISDILGVAEGASILDVGCGTGRHAVALAARGYRVTGVDLSTGMLAKAAAAAKQAGVEVEWVHADAAAFRLDRQFDAALCLCEGSLGLLGAADDPIAQPLKVLTNISRHMKDNAPMIATVLNGLAMVRNATAEDISGGVFDPSTLTWQQRIAPVPGHPEVAVKEHGFAPTELRLLFDAAGMDVEHLWGGTAGQWNRQPLKIDEIEIMVIARRRSTRGR